MTNKKFLLGFLAVGIAEPASAHGSDARSGGFFAGFAHPFSEADCRTITDESIDH
jgi:hydrogenase/urease accessory protein HupE